MMYLDKCTNPVKYPGSIEKMRELGLRDVKDIIKNWRTIHSNLLEAKEMAARNGFKLPYNPEDYNDPLK